MEEKIDYHICTYPDCGCPESRLCMAGNPNEAAINLNRPPSEYRSKQLAKERIYGRKN